MKGLFCFIWVSHEFSSCFIILCSISFQKLMWDFNPCLIKAVNEQRKWNRKLFSVKLVWYKIRKLLTQEMGHKSSWGLLASFSLFDQIQIKKKKRMCLKSLEQKVRKCEKGPWTVWVRRPETSARHSEWNVSGWPSPVGWLAASCFYTEGHRSETVTVNYLCCDPLSSVCESEVKYENVKHKSIWWTL